MKYIIVDKSNIDLLYKLNRQLAINEKQLSLFSAKKSEYKKAFISKNPIVFGILIYKKDRAIGFIIYINKFATYLASKVLFIEDIFLEKEYQTRKNINSILRYIINISKKNRYARVEMRVLKSYSLDKTIIKQNGFSKVKKWDIYRFV